MTSLFIVLPPFSLWFWFLLRHKPLCDSFCCLHTRQYLSANCKCCLCSELKLGEMQKVKTEPYHCNLLVWGMAYVNNLCVLHCTLHSFHYCLLSSFQTSWHLLRRSDQKDQSTVFIAALYILL